MPVCYSGGMDVTEEMMNAYREAVRQGGDSTDDIRRTAVQAVLDIATRDHAAEILAAAKRGYENGQRDAQALIDMGY